MCTSKWIEKVETDNAKDFLKVLSIHSRPFRVCNEDYLFRGHGNAGEYRLIPTVLRPENETRMRLLCASANPRNYYDPQFQLFQVLLEVDLLASFISLADECGLVIPDLDVGTIDRLNSYREHLNGLAAVITANTSDDPVKDLEQPFLQLTEDCSWPIRSIHRHLALARHSGIPTRLLDWSRSPRVGAYFAAADAAERLNELVGRGRQMEVWAFARSAARWKDKPMVADWVERVPVPHAMNSNMGAQRGQFTTIRVPATKLIVPVDRRSAEDVVISGLEAMGFEPQDFQCPPMVRVLAPVETSSEVLWYLAREGVARHMLFPEFGSIHRAIEDRSRETTPSWWDDAE